MPEIVLKIGDSLTYKDGDVADAFNVLRTRSCHAQHICHVKHIGTIASGHRPANSLTEMMLSYTREYKCIRISATEKRRINLKTLDEEVIEGIPNIGRLLLSPLHLVFGTPGAEVWYEGRTIRTATTLDKVWAEIEKRTELREVDYRLWPFGQKELRLFLAVPTNDFDDVMLEGFKSPQMDGTDKVAERKYHVEWETDLGLSLSEKTAIQDPNVSIDLREVKLPYEWASIAKVKTLAVN